MKTPDPTKAESSAPNSANSMALGKMPKRVNTVKAEVLERMLSGERLTGLDAVNEASTTRLAAVVHALHRDYGWSVEREDKAAGCRDGRIAWIREYFLSDQTIAAAMNAGAAEWCASVRAARMARRADAAEARRVAARVNSEPWTILNSGQGGMFEGCTA